MVIESTIPYRSVKYFNMGTQSYGLLVLNRIELDISLLIPLLQSNANIVESVITTDRKRLTTPFNYMHKRPFDSFYREQKIYSPTFE